MHARSTYRFRPVSAAAALLAASCGAMADEPSPYYVGVTEAITHDSNVYRIPDGPSGTYTSTGLVGGFDQSIGRQHFSGSGNIRYNKYLSEDSLDNTSYGLNAGWDWSTIWNLSGGVNLSAGQSLASYGGNATLPTTSRNIVQTDQIGGSLQYGGPGRFSLGAQYAHSRVHYSAPEYQYQQSSGDTAGLTLYYNVSPTLTAGIGYRLTWSDSPYGLQTGVGQYDSLTSRGRNVDLTLNYHFSSQTNFSGRLSFTNQSNSGAAGLDFSGVTGGLTANYAPTGKLAFNASYARDAGTNGNFFNVPASSGTTLPNTGLPNTGLYQNSQTTDSLAAGVTYAATAKINVNAGYTYRRAKIVGTTTAAGVSSTSGYTDNLKLASLGVTYVPLRWATVGCNVSHENRNVSATNGFSYSDNTVSCTFQATLR